MTTTARERHFVRPARAGLKVPDPDHGGHLPESGAWVNWSTFWQRQLQDGDVVVADAEAPAESN